MHPKIKPSIPGLRWIEFSREQKYVARHQPDFLLYDFACADEYQRFWDSVANDKNKKYLYSDGHQVKNVNVWQYVWQNVRGFFGWPNYCSKPSIQLALSKIAYAGYLNGWNDPISFPAGYNNDMALELFKAPVLSENTHSAQAELLRVYSDNFANRRLPFWYRQGKTGRQVFESRSLSSFGDYYLHPQISVASENRLTLLAHALKVAPQLAQTPSARAIDQISKILTAQASQAPYLAQWAARNIPAGSTIAALLTQIVANTYADGEAFRYSQWPAVEESFMPICGDEKAMQAVLIRVGIKLADNERNSTEVCNRLRWLDDMDIPLTDEECSLLAEHFTAPRLEPFSAPVKQAVLEKLVAQNSLPNALSLANAIGTPLSTVPGYDPDSFSALAARALDQQDFTLAYGLIAHSNLPTIDKFSQLLGTNMTLLESFDYDRFDECFSESDKASFPTWLAQTAFAQPPEQIDYAVVLEILNRCRGTEERPATPNRLRLEVLSALQRQQHGRVQTLLTAHPNLLLEVDVCALFKAMLSLAPEVYPSLNDIFNELPDEQSVQLRREILMHLVTTARPAQEPAIAQHILNCASNQHPPLNDLLSIAHVWLAHRAPSVEVCFDHINQAYEYKTTPSGSQPLSTQLFDALEPIMLRRYTQNAAVNRLSQPYVEQVVFPALLFAERANEAVSLIQAYDNFTVNPDGSLDRQLSTLSYAQLRNNNTRYQLTKHIRNRDTLLETLASHGDAFSVESFERTFPRAEHNELFHDLAEKFQRNAFGYLSTNTRFLDIAYHLYPAVLTQNSAHRLFNYHIQAGRYKEAYERFKNTACLERGPTLIVNHFCQSSLEQVFEPEDPIRVQVAEAMWGNVRSFFRGTNTRLCLTALSILPSAHHIQNAEALPDDTAVLLQNRRDTFEAARCDVFFAIYISQRNHRAADELWSKLNAEQRRSITPNARKEYAQHKFALASAILDSEAFTRAINLSGEQRTSDHWQSARQAFETVISHLTIATDADPGNQLYDSCLLKALCDNTSLTLDRLTAVVPTEANKATRERVLNSAAQKFDAAQSQKDKIDLDASLAKTYFSCACHLEFTKLEMRIENIMTHLQSNQLEAAQTLAHSALDACQHIKETIQQNGLLLDPLLAKVFYLEARLSERFLEDSPLCEALQAQYGDDWRNHLPSKACFRIAAQLDPKNGLFEALANGCTSERLTDSIRGFFHNWNNASRTGLLWNGRTAQRFSLFRATTVHRDMSEQLPDNSADSLFAPLYNFARRRPDVSISALALTTNIRNPAPKRR